MPKGGFISFLEGILIATLALIGFFVNYRQTKENSGEPLLGPLWGKALTVLLTLLGYALLLNFLGFLICTFLFGLILLRFLDAYKWKTASLWAMGMAGMSYLIFQVWLKSQLPMGLLHYFHF